MPHQRNRQTKASPSAPASRVVTEPEEIPLGRMTATFVFNGEVFEFDVDVSSVGEEGSIRTQLDADQFFHGMHHASPPLTSAVTSILSTLTREKVVEGLQHLSMFKSAAARYERDRVEPTDDSGGPTG